MFGKSQGQEPDKKRFIVKSIDEVAEVGRYFIVVDRVTGVHYLQTWVDGGSSITPLLDAQGRIVIEHGPIQ